MPALFRSLCFLGGLAMLAACNGAKDADNLAALDAKLTNGAVDGVSNEVIDAEVLAAVGGRMEKAPTAIETADSLPGARALSDLIHKRTGKDGSGASAGAAGDCAKFVQYGAEWAERMPEPFRAYPRARLIEAAGTAKAPCTLRLLSFSTPAGPDAVMDFYFTQAKRAGYDAEHLLIGNEHQLGGTKGEAAYVVLARRGEGQQTEVDVVANAL